MKKHFTEQMADFVARPWSEIQEGDLDGDHSDILTHAPVTLVRKKMMRLLEAIIWTLSGSKLSALL
jgi:hypothetical protein